MYTHSWVCLQDSIVERSHAATFSLSVICVEGGTVFETLPMFTATGLNNYTQLQVENP